ncbi:hypothetical protein GWI33_020304 [Rhynchophorus ferrugineus]|uniref:Uncharacterized protein n=1 Tax=Rhynchophorus ferrugineus TaxID=354439 RepID=A0A834HUF1_RHYFE|nr:hypothetical protein GWI33_020304 [Rhynchophorus ferrugineus]
MRRSLKLHDMWRSMMEDPPNINITVAATRAARPSVDGSRTICLELQAHSVGPSGASDSPSVMMWNE